MPNKSDKTVPKIKIKNNTIVPASTDEDGFRSPRTPRGNKFNTNNSPTQSQFASPNRFATLQDSNIFDFNNTDSTKDTTTVTQTHNESTNMDMSKTSPLKRQIPPIFIVNQKLDYNLLYKSLINLVGENGFHCKSTQKHTKVQANTSDDYRQIIHFLTAQKNAQFHTYQPQDEKPFGVVLRNLHPSTSYEEIKSALENFNLSILQFAVRYRSSLSDQSEIQAGVPQGAIAAPLLFNIFIADQLPQTTSTNTLVAEYADDKAIISTHENPLIASNMLQNHLTQIESWCKNWKVKINESKSCHITFTLKQGLCPQITFNNIQIPTSLTTKYLDRITIVIIDEWYSTD
ncbi:hypothetical protein QTP88_003644 [Uroleucon formosanum]